MSLRLLKISFKNIFRNRRRSLITFSILAIGGCGLILIGGFFNDLITRLRESIIHSQTGHLQVAASGYFDRGAGAPLDFVIPNAAKVQGTLETFPHVLYTVPRFKITGTASSSKTSLSSIIVGVDPVQEKRMTSFTNPKADTAATAVSEGRDLSADDPYGALLGQGLMKALRLKIGDPVTVTVLRQGGAIDGATYHIRGTFETSMKDFDDHAMKVTLPSVQKILGLHDGINTLLVVLDRTEATQLMKDVLEAQFRKERWPLEVIPWDAEMAYYRQSRDLLNRIQSTVQVIVGVIFFFSVANTVNMSIHERVREYGTMMAIGNTRSCVFSMIFTESFFLGCLGAAGAVLTGMLLAAIVSSVGIHMPPPPHAASGYVAMITPTPTLLWQTLGLTLLACMLASLVPAYRASHFKITEALAYV